jgi:sec-independent protein translocase protein TatB
MFGIDSPELLVILVVALVVIGPKELPALLKTWGKWMATMRGMASEFRGHVDEMVRQSELDEVKKQLESSTGGLDFKALDPTKQMKSLIQDGVAEGEKALAEARTSLDNPPVEPLIEPPPATPEALAAVVAPSEPEPAVPPETPAHENKSQDDKPKAAAAG